MTGTVRIEEGPFEADHPRCLECNRPLKNPKWRKIGRGKKCYAKHCKNMQQQSQETQDLIPVAEEHAKNFLQVEGAREQRLLPDDVRQDRAPDPKISKAEKRAALDQALQEEMGKKNPEPTEEQRRAAEKRLLQDVDKALGVEEDGREDEEAADPADSAGEEDKERTGKKKRVKAPKGQAIVRAGSFNRGSRSIEVERNV